MGLRNPISFVACLGQEPRPGQTWIATTVQSSPLTRRSTSPTSNTTHFNYQKRKKSKSDIHIPFGYYRRFNGTSNSSINTQHFGDELYNRTGFTSWMDASCDRAFWPRRSFVQELKKLLSLDDLRSLWNQEMPYRRKRRMRQAIRQLQIFLGASPLRNAMIKS